MNISAFKKLNQRFPNVAQNNVNFAKDKKQKIANDVVDNFSPFNIYLWLHFVGFTTKVELSRRSLKILFISIIFSILNEGFTVIIIVSKLLQLKEMALNRKIMIELFSEIGELYVRILVIIKRRQLISLVEEVAEIYADEEKNNRIKFKAILIAILLLSECYYFIRAVLNFSDVDFHLYPYLGDTFYFEFIKYRYSSTLFYICNHLHHVNMLTPFVIQYFCCICYVLKQTSVNFKQKLIVSQNIDVSSLSQYNRIIKVISLVNKVMHNMLAAALFLLIVWMFYASYIIVFTKQESTPKRIAIFMLFSSTFTQFSSVCIFESSVIDAVNDLNDYIFDLPLRVSHDSNLPFLLKANRKFNGFTLFRQIVIDKILILSAFGSLLTYGILIATFNV